jgi:SAM-dependent methyltransferase
MDTTEGQRSRWGTQARTWANLAEPISLPAYEIVFERLTIGSGTRLCDIGCGAGLALQLAARRGARVAGLDASEALLEIARERLPLADLRVGDMQALPYPDHDFDVVTGFNSFQFASSPVLALLEARRITKGGGVVAMVMWGRAQDCHMAAVQVAVSTCGLSPREGTVKPSGFSEPGQVEEWMQQAGLTPQESGEVVCPFEVSDEAAAWAALGSAGTFVRAVEDAGEARVKQAVLGALLPFRTCSGGYRLENRFRYVIALA